MRFQHGVVRVHLVRGSRSPSVMPCDDFCVMDVCCFLLYMNEERACALCDPETRAGGGARRWSAGAGGDPRYWYAWLNDEEFVTCSTGFST